LQQGGDMVRVAGLTYSIAPTRRSGGASTNLRIDGVPLSADRRYKGGRLAPVNEAEHGPPVWEVVADICATSRW